MKLLLDQNLSRRLLAHLETRFPGSSQAALCGLDTASDVSVWAYAREHGYAVVTKDADFLELSLLRGFPPKVIWLNLGNASNQRIGTILLEQADNIATFLQTASEGVLAIG